MILDGTLKAAELSVSQNAGYPTSVELPIITATHGRVPASATLPLFDAENANSRDGIHCVGISLPEAVSEAAEEVKSGPIIKQGSALGVGSSSVNRQQMLKR